MPRFRYQAADALGKKVSGELTAANDIDLDLRLRRMGLMLVWARLARRRALLSSQRITRRDLISFCFHIQQIARSHASLLDGLKDLVAGAENTRFRDLLILVTDDLEGGKLLSEALAAHPDVFDRVFLALVRAAEKSDQIETVFARLETRLKQQEELQAEFTRLLIYPGITALAVLAAAGVMLFYLTPRLAGLIVSLNLPMPLATRMLIAMSDLARHHLPWLLGLLLTAAVSARLAMRIPASWRSGSTTCYCTCPELARPSRNMPWRGFPACSPCCCNPAWGFWKRLRPGPTAPAIGSSPARSTPPRSASPPAAASVTACVTRISCPLWCCAWC